MRSPLPFARPKHLIILWPGEPYTVSWDGEGVRLPGDGAVVKDDKTNRFLSAKDPRTGEWMPGTIVLKAEERFDEKTGNKILVFDPEAWCRGAFGDESQTGPAFGMTERGLRIVADAAEVTPQLYAECREEWENAQDVADQNLIQEELRRRRGYDKDGKEAPPLQAKAEAALQAAMNRSQLRNIKKQRSAISTADLMATLSGQSPANPTPPPVAPRPKADKGAIDAVLAAAKEAGVVVKTEELVALEQGDRIVMNAVLDRITDAMKSPASPPRAAGAGGDATR